MAHIWCWPTPRLNNASPRVISDSSAMAPGPVSWSPRATGNGLSFFNCSSFARQSAQSPRFDRSLLDALSSDRATQDALTSVIPIVSRQNPGEAQELLRRVTNPEVRREIEEQIERLDALPR